MVTVTHNDLPAYYLDVNYWIVSGITNDAVYFIANRWAESKYNRRIVMIEIRNKIKDYSDKRFQPLYPLNKW